MSTIVINTETGRRYILLGAGYGLWAEKGSIFDGDAQMAVANAGGDAMLAVADVNGRVGWIASQKLRVESIGGKLPETVLAEGAPYR